MLTALAFKGYMEVNWDKTATRDGFVRYNFKSGEVLWLEKDWVQVEERAYGIGGSSTTPTLVAVPVLFRACRERADISAIRRDSDGHRAWNLIPELASGVDLDILFDQDLLQGQARDSDELSEKNLTGTGALIKKVGYNVPVFNKGYVDLVHSCPARWMMLVWKQELMGEKWRSVMGRSSS